MARQVGKLTVLDIKNETRPGLYGDGAGLYLNVGPTGGKSWIFRYMLNGKAREMGLGPLHTITLAQARQRAADQRRAKLDGIDPLEQRRATKAAAALAAARVITFKACATKYIAANKAGWRNAKHGAQWTATLTAYAYPVIGDLAVNAIDTGHITRILEPIWVTKSETATRVRGRVEAVLDYARTHRWREGENPARWKGHLENVLPKPSKVRRVEHHAALAWGEVAGFMRLIEKQDGVAALALRFAILTAARTGEVIGARWEEIDLATGVWTVPEERMKGHREHRVPLSKPALAVLTETAALRQGDAPFVFPGGKAGRPLSNMAMLVLLRRMERGDLTAHGFRSSFRDWAAETGQASDIAEAALAHVVGDKAVIAFQRGDLLERRRKLMAGWAEYCEPATVTEDARLEQGMAGAAV
jgi:integrase